jgi:hypothetical protein
MSTNKTNDKPNAKDQKVVHVKRKAPKRLVIVLESLRRGRRRLQAAR